MRICRQFLEVEEIDTTDWPPRSIQFNISATLCFGRHDALVQICMEITQDTIQLLNRTMPRCCPESKKAHGEHTKLLGAIFVLLQ